MSYLKLIIQKDQVTDFAISLYSTKKRGLIAREIKIFQSFYDASS